MRRDRGRASGQDTVDAGRGLRDFGGTVTKWLRRADVNDGVKPGVTRVENAELRELRKRNRLLE